MSQETIIARVPGGVPADDLTATKSSRLRTAARIGLGAVLAGAGVAHITVAREPFQAQVPKTLTEILPFSADDIVFGSGVVEIALGAALIGLPKEKKRLGAIAAAYFIAIFPGNIAQLVKHQDAFGLDTDAKRVVRLLFQPLLVLWSLFAGENI